MPRLECIQILPLAPAWFSEKHWISQTPPFPAATVSFSFSSDRDQAFHGSVIMFHPCWSAPVCIVYQRMEIQGPASKKSSETYGMAWPLSEDLYHKELIELKSLDSPNSQALTPVYLREDEVLCEHPRNTLSRLWLLDLYWVSPWRS